MRILPAGPRALLVELDGQQDARRFYAEVQRRRRAGWQPSLQDVVPAARTVLLDGLDDPARAAPELAGWPLPPVTAGSGPPAEIPTVYDGEDLGEIARVWNMTREEAVATHTGIDFEVAFCGFSPGFAYLAGLPEDLHVPRRPSPRALVPASAVALAGEYSGIYPRPSPGGWQLIGRSQVKVWDERRDPPTLLTPGMRVHFVAAGRGAT
jgi:KipI family sensor histidine kinase inhibitor